MGLNFSITFLIWKKLHLTAWSLAAERVEEDSKQATRIASKKRKKLTRKWLRENYDKTRARVMSNLC